MKTVLKILIIILLILPASCSQPRINFDRGIIPPEAANFSGVNSSYDDYNSEIITSTLESSFTLVFSTNRFSYGENSGINTLSDEGYLTIHKAEFPDRETVYFTSNREGGFDVWYSIYEGTEWSAPENFGESINTEYDEYRPAIMETNPDEFLNNLMIMNHIHLQILFQMFSRLLKSISCISAVLLLFESTHVAQSFRVFAVSDLVPVYEDGYKNRNAYL